MLRAENIEAGYGESLVLQGVSRQAEIAPKVADVFDTLRTVHAVMNNNDEGLWQRNAKTPTKLLKGAQTPRNR